MVFFFLSFMRMKSIGLEPPANMAYLTELLIYSPPYWISSSPQQPLPITFPATLACDFKYHPHAPFVTNKSRRVVQSLPVPQDITLRSVPLVTSCTTPLLRTRTLTGIQHSTNLNLETPHPAFSHLCVALSDSKLWSTVLA